MKYSDVLIEDHEALRKLMKQIKSARLSPKKKAIAYDLFVDLLESHTKAEEQSLYRIRKENNWLRPDILEGLQEHRIADELLEKIKRTKNPDLQEAKKKVLCDYVEHHLKEEEEDLFPHFEKTISKHQSQELQDLYLQIRLETQMNPTDLSHGAL
ncbi:MAG: hemerythrin domain-containing protein [Bdellovibrionaceae bacterium]|nr:hemerythrin domain-containing protein [Pseudobdellovibrionaceae bacterium]